MKNASNIQMIENQLEKRGIKDKKVLDAFLLTPRDQFVSLREKDHAWEDNPLPIGKNQTISQPYIVALMSEQLQLRGHEKVLEIGTGCGYQTAILARLAREVHSIEIIPELHCLAKKNLKGSHFKNVYLYCQDGASGLPQHQPFDAIIATSAPRKIPNKLLDQLKSGGKMIIPVGEFIQELLAIEKTQSGYKRTKICDVRFVPMTGSCEDDSD